jgi:hypothetical protein
LLQAGNKPAQAEQADRHFLYQESVQDVGSEIDFVEATWNSLRGRPAVLLREDFCGTANTSCEWVRRNQHAFATAIDLDAGVLEWGRANNLTALSPQQRERVKLVRADVRDSQVEPADIILAMNFSYYLFLERNGLLSYFRATRAGLKPGGILFLDAYGGYEAPMVLQEPRKCDGFTYIWDQASFNPIDSSMDCHIHFEFPDGSRIDRAFSYRWRLWTLPEIRELLAEAGFAQVDVYWEGTDEETNEGNGIYTPATLGDADPGWVCYVVAQA